MSGPMSERWPNVLAIPLGTQAASIELPGAYFRKRSRLKAAMLINQAGVTADPTNYLVLTLQDVGATPGVYASFDTRAANQGALTALVPAAMTLGGGTILGGTAGAVATTVLGDTTNPEVDIAAAGKLMVKITANATVQLTDAVLLIEFYPL